MEFKLSKNQYRVLIQAMQITGTVYAVLGDMVDRRFKRRSDEVDEIESLFLSYGKNFGMEKIIEKFDGRLVLKDAGVEEMTGDLFEYEEYTFWENLASKLAVRDFVRQYGEEAIKKMDEIERIRLKGEIEEHYWKEFEDHGVERIKVL